MDIRLNRVELLSELVPMQGVVERRTTIPVLSHVLLRATGGRLEIAATDLEVSLTSSCEAEVQEEGAIAIQAKKLLDIIRAAAGDEVTLRIADEGTLTILVGKSRFKIRGLSADDFPTLPDVSAEAPLIVPFMTFRGMIGKIFYAISSEESRFQLSGALLKVDDGALSLIATDGHRLALVETEVAGLEAAEGILVPRKTLQELQRFESPGDLEIRHTEHHLSFSVGQRQLICRVLEGSFPDYERVIAKDNDKIVAVDRKALAGLVHRVSLLTGDRSRVVRLELEDGLLRMTAANPDLGEAMEEAPCDYTDGDLTIGVNPDYLGHFLAAAETERIQLQLKNQDSQCVAMPVEGPDKRYVCVIMPIRL